LRELTEEIANLDINVNQWFLDDGHIVGKVSEVLKALEIIEVKGIMLGLLLNLTKCVVFGKHTDDFPDEVMRATVGLLVLGAPVGTSHFVENEVRKIVKKATDALLKIRELNDPQSELLLLRTCSGSQKLIYWMRTCSPEAIRASIIIFDERIDDALQHIFGVPVRGRERLTIHLPLSLGGVGIPIASLSVDHAFCSSVGASWHLQPNFYPRHGFLGSLQ
jgi:hypothetical protein